MHYEYFGMFKIRHGPPRSRRSWHIFITTATMLIRLPKFFFICDVVSRIVVLVWLGHYIMNIIYTFFFVIKIYYKNQPKFIASCIFMYTHYSLPTIQVNYFVLWSILLYLQIQVDWKACSFKYLLCQFTKDINVTKMTPDEI